VLRFKHGVLIAAVAVVGIVGGYLVTAGHLGSSGRTPSSVGQPLEGSSSTPGPTKQMAAAGPAVPELHGSRLPDALARLEAAGYKKVRTVDASPENRVILEKENWVVDSQEPAGGTAAPVSTQVVLKVKKNTDDSVPQAAALGVVPNVMCAELQAAQDALRGSGFLLISSTDGTGQGRLATLDRNWVVIGQSEPAGSKPGLTTHIVLTVVKHGESGGSSGCKT
jgi:hypothetical protein